MRKGLSLWAVVLLILVTLVAGACKQAPTPTPVKPTPTSTPTRVAPTPPPSPTPVPTPTPSPTPKPTPTPAPPVKVALLFPMTGAAAAWGLPAVEAIKMKLDMVNEAGGIKSLGGAKIEAVILDTESKPDVGQARAERISDDVVAVFGVNQSATVRVVAPVLERLGVPFLMSIDIEGSVLAQGFKNMFQFSAPFPELARQTVETAAYYVDKTGVKPTKVAVVHHDLAGGPDAGLPMEDYAKQKGWNVIRIVYPLATTKDFTTIVSQLKSAGVDLVLHVSYPADAILFTQGMKELDFNPIAVLGTAGGYNSIGFEQTLGKYANYAISTAHTNNDMVISGVDVKGLDQKFRQRSGLPYMDNIAGAAFSTAVVLVDALERAGVASRKALREALLKTDLKTGDGGYLMPEGVKFDERGGNVRAAFVSWQMLNGERRTVWPEKYASTKAVWPRPKWSGM